MKTFIKILVFLLIGEVVFQVHKYAAIKHINDVADTLDKPITLDTNVNNIFLLGDSYVKGLGIPNESRISSNIQKNGYVVSDHSHSSDNWADYVDKIKANTENFKNGDIIVIGVNWNDVDFNKGAIDYVLFPPDSDADSTTKKSLLKNTRNKGIRKAIHFLYRNSAMISFLSSNLQNTLKRHGMPLPIGSFHYYKEKAYHTQKKELDLAMDYLLILSRKHNLNIVLYLLPDFNLTKNTSYFKDFTDYFNQYKNEERFIIVNGVEYYKHAKDGEYCMSIHDGHPNAKAHMSIATQINNCIDSIRLINNVTNTPLTN